MYCSYQKTIANQIPYTITIWRSIHFKDLIISVSNYWVMSLESTCIIPYRQIWVSQEQPSESNKISTTISTASLYPPDKIAPLNAFLIPSKLLSSPSLFSNRVAILGSTIWQYKFHICAMICSRTCLELWDWSHCSRNLQMTTTKF